jgi:hypothetical protein
MITRSQAAKLGNAEFDENFFEEASKAWRANKKVGPNMTFTYRCEMTHKNGKPCKRNALDSIHTENMTCAQHRPKS